jgi:nucleoside-diphosphate-sugar epimerase
MFCTAYNATWYYTAPHMAKLLVTGAAGKVASVLIPALAKDHELRGFWTKKCLAESVPNQSRHWLSATRRPQHDAAFSTRAVFAIVQTRTAKMAADAKLAHGF